MTKDKKPVTTNISNEMYEFWQEHKDVIKLSQILEDGLRDLKASGRYE